MSTKNLTDFYINESTDLNDFKSNPNVIARKSLLKHIYGAKYQGDDYIPPISLDWFPRCNSYYPYTEDVDAINRVDHLIAAKKFLESFTSIKKDARNNFDPYDETESQIKYLQSEPAIFLILGKPGIGEQQLGKLIADNYKCVYIDPETLIHEEIMSGNRAGQCIEFNLRCGRAISIDVILRLAEKRVKSKSAQHRGFVICGFPLIRNDMYQDDPVSSESAIFTAQEIFEEILEPIGRSSHVLRNVSKTSQVSREEETPEEEEDVQPEDDEKEETIQKPSIYSVDIGSATGDVFKAIDIGTNYAAQLNFLFNLCHEPLVIIYIMCQNYDVVTKHENYRYNLKTNKMVDLMKDHGDNIVYTIYTKTPGFVNEDLPDDLYNIPNYSEGLSNSELMYLTYLPCNFSGNVQAQLEQYRFEVLPTIEKHVLLHDPHYFIKVDGRLSSVKMFNIIKTKIRILPLPPVIIPEKLVEPVIPTGAEHELLEEFDYENKTPEECFSVLKRKKIINRMFKLQWSRWESVCPVAMKEGTYADGKPKYAVKFLNQIYFLSDEDNLTKFIRNPRPYLLPPCPRSTCKIIIIGPKSAGKTAIARALAIFLNGRILDAVVLQMNYLKRIEKETMEKIRTDAINEAVQLLGEIRQKEYQEKEKERMDKVQQWYSQTNAAIGDRILLQRTIQFDIDPSEISSFPQRAALKAGFSPAEMSKFKEDIDEIKEIFEKLQLTFFEDMELCENLYNDSSGLEEYLPPELKECTGTPDPVSIFDDFVTKYADEAVERATLKSDGMAVEDMEDMYINAIREVEEQNIEAGEHHGGWIIDGIPPNPDLLDLIFEKYRPDDIFILRDPDGSFLMDRYKIFGQNEYKDYGEFFRKIGKKSIADRCPSATSTFSYKMRLGRRILDKILDGKDIPEDPLEATAEEEGDYTSVEGVEFVDEDYFATRATRLELKHYQNTLRKFESDLEKLIDFFEEFGIEYKEINLDHKPLEELMKEVVLEIDSRFQYHAHELTPEERVEEVADFGEPEMPGEDFDEEFEEKNPLAEETFMQNRRLGDTNVFCPVTFSDYWVLWKGKEEYAAVYNDKLYFMCDEEALSKFIRSPRQYLRTTAVDTLPPPRICIIGVPGSGKTTLAKTISATLGLYYISYENYLKRMLDEENNESNLETILNYLDNPMIETITDYLDNDEPLPDEALDKMNLKEIWFEEPKRSVGFVLDGFPRRTSDLEYVQENVIIPDVILELTTTDVEANRRYVERLIDEWRVYTQKAQEEQDKYNRQLMNDWEEVRTIRIEELMEDRRQARYQAKLGERRVQQENLDIIKEENEEFTSSTERSLISYDSVAEEADLEEVRAIVKEELPEPIFEDNWETLEEATERIVNQTENAFKADIEYIKHIKEYCESQLIEWVALDANVSINKVFDQAMRVVDKFKFRNRSLFERHYDVSVDVAEKLLDEGYHFLSRFAKVCPVQIYEKNNPILLFYPLEQKMEVFPIIHRNYIYFLAGKKNRDKFVKDPLLYIMQSDVSFPLIPFRIALIGPPKSGKTMLAERFKRDLSLKYISIGQAARYVLRSFPHSQLAKEMEAVLRNGWELTSEMTMKCVEAMAFDGRAITQGMVFDGFPNSRHDVDHLAEIGLIPNLVLHLDANMDDIQLFLKTDKGRRGLPVFSNKFIDHRCEVWFHNVDNTSDWLDKEYQMWKKIKVEPSKWGVWTAAEELVLAALFEIKYYFKNCNRDMALRLGNMQITPSEFRKRRSCYKHYCPSCLYYDNRLVNGGDPPDRTGLVQFKNNFYWLCYKHIDEFVNDPESFLPPYNERVLPGDLPMQLILESKPGLCYENGVCITCYWDSQPDRIIKQGVIAFACSYKDKTYLFDSKECMDKFVNEPCKYFGKIVHFKNSRRYSSLKMEDLPILGMLEQYVAKNVVKAVTNTGVTRPLIAGLSIEKSAAINMALHMKVHNLNTPKEFLPLYENAFKVFTERRLKFIDSLAYRKRTINPYLHYEEPLEKFTLPQSDRPDDESSTELCTIPGEDKIEDDTFSMNSILDDILRYLGDE